MTVVADPEATAFAKMAAARHSSNTTAEGMTYLPVDLGPQYSMEALVGQLAGKVKDTFSQSKLTGEGWITQWPWVTQWPPAPWCVSTAPGCRASVNSSTSGTWPVACCDCRRQSADASQHTASQNASRLCS